MAQFSGMCPSHGWHSDHIPKTAESCAAQDKSATSPVMRLSIKASYNSAVRAEFLNCQFVLTRRLLHGSMTLSKSGGYLFVYFLILACSLDLFQVAGLSTSSPGAWSGAFSA